MAELGQVEVRGKTTVKGLNEPAKPSHHQDGGLFSCPWPGWEDKSLGDIVSWLKWRKANNMPPRGWLQGIHRPTAADYAKALPLNAVDWQALNNPPENAVQALWVGHACLLVQMDGVSFLTDPALSKRCSAVQWAGPSRLVPNPLDLDNPDLKLDFVVISHDHYDHLDSGSVARLNKRFGKELTWYVPLRLKQWFTLAGVKSVVDLDWWETVRHPGSECDITFTPAQHWSMRAPWSRNHTLWGGWAVKGPRHSFWFAGDTGYCPAFQEIGARLGPFDLSAIPIGAYIPRHFLKFQHCDPAEALKIHKEVGSKRSIGIHWGTWPLGDEAADAAPHDLQKALQAAGMPATEFLALQHGAILRTAGGADANSPPLMPLVDNS